MPIGGGRRRGDALLIHRVCDDNNWIDAPRAPRAPRAPARARPWPTTRGRGCRLRQCPAVRPLSDLARAPTALYTLQVRDTGGGLGVHGWWLGVWGGVGVGGKGRNWVEKEEKVALRERLIPTLSLVLPSDASSIFFLPTDTRFFPGSEGDLFPAHIREDWICDPVCTVPPSL